MNASAIKDLHYKRYSNPIIFKYYQHCNSLIAQAFIRLLIYDVIEKIANVRSLIWNAVQIKNWRKIGLLSATHNDHEVIFSVM